MLSRAAARGVALRGMLPRSDDSLVSLMPIGTEQAYLERQASFFVRVGLKLLMVTGVLAAVMLAAAWGYLLTLEQQAAQQAERQLAAIPAETLEVLEETRRINTAMSQVVGLLSPYTIAPDLVGLLTDAAPTNVVVDKVFIRTSNAGGLSVDVSVQAQRGRDLQGMEAVLRDCFVRDRPDGYPHPAGTCSAAGGDTVRLRVYAEG
jgi:hypothetical protein